MCLSSFHFKLGKSLQTFLRRLNVNNLSLRVISLQESATFKVRRTNHLFDEFHLKKKKNKNKNNKITLLTCTLSFAYSAYVSSGPGAI